MKHLFRSLIAISGLTLLSRITGLIREIFIASSFGANAWTDAFNVAFRLPNLLRRLSAEGAFSQAFVPILTQVKNQQSFSETQAFISAMATILLAALVLISALGVLYAASIVGWVAGGLAQDAAIFKGTVLMTRMMFPYIALISLTSFASSILNTCGRFALPAFAPTLLNLSLIFCAWQLAPYLDTPIYALAIGVIIGGSAQLLIQLPALKRIGFFPKIHWNLCKAARHPAVKQVLFKIAPAILAVSVAQISLMINTHIASYLGKGNISWLTYADRLMEFPTALLGIALGTLLLPNLSKAYSNQDATQYAALLDWALRLCFIFATPCALALLIYAKPLTAVLYQYGQFSAYDVMMTARALSAYGVGLVSLILIKILAPGFYSRQNVKTPVKIAVFVLAVTQGANFLLVPYFSVAGLALSISIGASLNALLLFWGLRKKGLYHPLPGWFFFFMRLMVSCGVLAGILYYFIHHFSWLSSEIHRGYRIIQFALSVLFAAGTYFLALWLSGMRIRDFYLQQKS